MQIKVNKDIDESIKSHFTKYFLLNFNISIIDYQLLKASRSCLFKFKVNGAIENFIISYQEDFIDEYTLTFKTTANEIFFYEFVHSLFNVVDYSNRFDRIINGLEQIKNKFKIFNRVHLLTSDMVTFKEKDDPVSGLLYTELVATRHILLSINQNLYTKKNKSHTLTSRIYFTFKKGNFEATCWLYNQSIRNKNIDLVDMWLTGNENVFNKELNDFLQTVTKFSYGELFYQISKEFGITIPTLMSMSESELKPYADLVGMLKI